ncbi:signal peptide peptidase SppA [Pseudoleptotrichia goodfellowii]|uniref:Signal peptide peptidase SppA, 67K type n=1 Tax=Pseudoleptotrichia goodfellowii TaxID=157692 RepID=A0A510JBF3_9FUSO|nr:signal peptide peptidase SppA [Pseudoleptotrichia goodfellowii]BBM35505.1 signal peptide peptidase SppA, 67K type [Pseudoleptotrichia goodfellowii]
MKFFDFIKRFLLFTIKEIYSFFLKLSLLFFVFFILLSSLIGYIISKAKDEDSISKNYNYVLLNVSSISEDKLDTSLFGETKKYNISYMDVLNSLEDIKNNDNIKGIIINLDQTNISSVKSEEISKKLQEIKNKNKKVYAFGAYMDNSNYPLASVANEIIMVPSASGSVSLAGYHYSDLYYKKLLSNVGVDMEVVRIGDFKSYGENYTSDTMSPGLRNELTRILESRFNSFLDKVSKARRLDKNKLNADILNGDDTNLTPSAARDKNFVDTLEYFNDLMTKLQINEDNIVDIYDYYADNGKRIEEQNQDKGTIAVIYAEGPIVYNEEAQGIYISPDNMAEKLKELSKIKDLKGVVLRVNSPGGSALASEMIYQMLSKINVPVYVSMSEVAASGGYYISMSGKKVFANDATITGSIGVVSMFPKFYNAQNKYGVTSNSISKGKYTDTFDPFVPLSTESRNKIIESMNATYDEFKSRVSKNRNMAPQVLENYAQGKIWLGSEAKEINLVDGIATLDETIKILARDLNLGDNYRVENIYAKKDFKETLKLLSSYIFEKFQLTSQLETKLPGSSKIMDEYKLIEQNKNKPMYYLPYQIKF